MDLRRLLRITENGLATMSDLRARPSTAVQAALAARLAADLKALLPEQKTGEGSAFWRGVCEDLHRLATSDDPMSFMRWPPIGATMVHGAAPITFREWWMLRRSRSWRSLWGPALRHPQYGRPPPFLPMLSTNAMAIEHAFHLFRFQHRMGPHLHDADCIVEFGGGFGSMCRLIRALGFRGRYVIFDLPPVLALQRYYLGLHGIEADTSAGADVWLCPGLDPIRDRLRAGRSDRVSLMSTWALSEMPISVRRQIEPFFRLDVVRLALLAYQPSFEGNDNRLYFRDLMSRTADRWNWSELAVDSKDRAVAPDDSLYMFGAASPP
jgi:hypothetical protein